jgi:hypothetical protein
MIVTQTQFDHEGGGLCCVCTALLLHATSHMGSHPHEACIKAIVVAVECTQQKCRSVRTSCECMSAKVCVALIHAKPLWNAQQKCRSVRASCERQSVCCLDPCKASVFTLRRKRTPSQLCSHYANAASTFIRFPQI